MTAKMISNLLRTGWFAVVLTWGSVVAFADTLAEGYIDFHFWRFNGSEISGEAVLESTDSSKAYFRVESGPTRGTEEDSYLISAWEADEQKGESGRAELRVKSSGFFDIGTYGQNQMTGTCRSVAENLGYFLVPPVPPQGSPFKAGITWTQSSQFDSEGFMAPTGEFACSELKAWPAGGCEITLKMLSQSRIYNERPEFAPTLYEPEESPFEWQMDNASGFFAVTRATSRDKSEFFDGDKWMRRRFDMVITSGAIPIRPVP